MNWEHVNGPERSRHVRPPSGSALTEFNVALLMVGALVLFVGAASERLRRASVLSEPIIALLAGVVAGPLGLGWLRPAEWGDPFEIMEEVARVTLALSLVSAALRLPRGYVRAHWRPLAVLLGLLMPLMWLAMGALSAWLLGLPLLVAALVGAVVTPTDPVIAGSIVTGSLAKEAIPARLRHLLSAESGANDGLAYPLVLLPILLLTEAWPQALESWAWRVVVWEVLGAALLGGLVGTLAGRLLRRVRGEAPGEILLTTARALALVTLAGGKLLGTDGVFAVFVMGAALKATCGKFGETQDTQEALNRFFVLPAFALLGLMLPWQGWLSLGWGGVLLAVGGLLLRRLPFVLALRPLISPIQRVRGALLLGWFGPIGVGALFYATLAQRETGNSLPWTVGTLLVTASVLAHGLSATSLTQRFGKAQEQDRGSQRAVPE